VTLIERTSRVLLGAWQACISSTRVCPGCSKSKHKLVLTKQLISEEYIPDGASARVRTPRWQLDDKTSYRFPGVQFLPGVCVSSLAAPIHNVWELITRIVRESSGPLLRRKLLFQFVTHRSEMQEYHVIVEKHCKDNLAMFSLRNLSGPLSVL
jgi:hypothetical protein